MKRKLFGLLMLLSFLIVMPVEAKEINSFHATSGDNVKVNDTINGDSAIAGNIIDMLGNIDGIGFMAGQTINLDGDLEYGFLAGQEININGNVSKNVYAAGNTINFSKDVNVGRDIFIAGQTVNLDGTLDRNVNISAEKVIINKGAIINGNISINTQNLIIQKDVVIKGKLEYNKDAENKINKDVSIGKIIKKDVQEAPKVDTKAMLISILNMVVVFLVITIIIPNTFNKVENLYKKNNNYLKSIGIGLLILICTPIISLILLVSNIGMYLGVILALLYVIALFLSCIFAGFILGKLLFVNLMKLNINNYLAGIMGIVLLKLLMLIPIFGTILGLIAITIGLTTIWNIIQKEENKGTNKEQKQIKNDNINDKEQKEVKNVKEQKTNLKKDNETKSTKKTKSLDKKD